MLRKLAATAVAATLAFAGLASPASADVPTDTGVLVRTGSTYVDQTTGTVYNTLAAGPEQINPLRLVQPSTSRSSWGLYYDEVGGGLYLIIEDGSDLWIIEL
ncbi:MAG TPA: hypothetical protein VGX28_09610 [Frankiaceae bacterium]|jgi:hypothetical protein|nr:hypothetical protein [Frankiaceae bacterium]